MTKADFVAAGEEIPESLINDDLHTEGELLSRDEIECWLADTNTTFCIIREQDEDRFGQLYEGYEADIAYLHSLGKLSAEEATQLTEKELFRFN